MLTPYVSAWSARLTGGVPSWKLRQATVQRLESLTTSDKRITAIPVLALGDVLQWTNYPDVEVFEDGSFRAGVGIASFDIRAIDSTLTWGAWATQTVVAPSAGPPVIGTTTLEEIDFNEPFEQQLSATGTVPITWDVSAGTLPTGITLSPTGLLSGTATVGLQSFNFTARATNTDGNDTQAYSGTVITPAPIAPTILTTALLEMTTGVAFSQQLDAIGDPTIEWEIYYPTVPVGLSLSITGLLSGTPEEQGQYDFTVAARNSTGEDLQQYSGRVEGVPEIILFDVQSPLNRGVPFSQRVTAAGIPTPTFRVSQGELPTGLSLSPDGVISETPTAVGIFNYTVNASNVHGFDERAYTQQIVETAGDLSTMTLNEAILFVTGGPTLNTGLFNYFGGAGTTLKDRERVWLETLTAVRGSIEDMWHDYLFNVRGYSGSRNDMELRFWQDGGAAGTPSVITKGYTAVWNQFAVSACGYRLNPLAGSLTPDNLFAGGTIAQLAVTDADVLYLFPLNGVQFPDIVPGFVWFSYTDDEFDTIALEWDTIDRYIAHVPGAYAQAQTNIGIPVRVRLSGDAP
jgi:hypothetical protein